MSKVSTVNWSRFVLCGVIASLICFMTDGFIHEQLLKGDWQAAFMASGAKAPGHNPSAFAYFGIFELGRGFLGVLVYVLVRGRLKPGAQTAALAGVISWIAFSIAGPAQYVPLGLITHAVWLKGAAYQLVTSMVSLVVGAAPYQERR
jgi:hypothetical protein